MTVIQWLVCCKHFRSSKGVNDIDEPDITDQVKRHKCHGFKGVYSTTATNTLTGKLEGLDIESSIYYNDCIEEEILKCKDKFIVRILISYFPDSYERFHLKKTTNSSGTKRKASRKKHLTEEDALRITATAIILLEIEKIQGEFSSSDEEQDKLISKLDKFSIYNNEKVADRVLEILDSIVDGARSRMPDDIAGSIFNSILSFYPSSYEASSKVRAELGSFYLFLYFFK